MAYREALPDGWERSEFLTCAGRERSEFLTCACCLARVNDDGSCTSGRRRRPKSPPPRPSVLCKDEGLTRRKESAWRVFNKERERAWRFCYWASGTKFPFPSQNINTGTLEEDQHLSAEDGIGTLEPPEDKSIKTLVIRGFKNTMRIHDQNIIDKFAAYGVIKSVSFFAEESHALVTFTTREGADKASQALSNCLFINGQRLKLAWATPTYPQPWRLLVVRAPLICQSSANTAERPQRQLRMNLIPARCFSDFQCSNIISLHSGM